MTPGRKVYPVSVVNRYVKTILDRDDVLSDLWVSGEISNLKLHSSGHLYFTLKDSLGAVNAVMFASDARRLKFRPENGAKVQARGSVTLYEKTGGYQLYVRQMEAEGTGDLYLAFEMLKSKLEAEGLFDPARKKPIPSFSRKVGIVTSPTGAAVRDIIQISRRRFPGVSLVLYPALVQGSGAAPTIVKGIETLDRMDDVDVIIVGRGGGSIEDLWPFNEEIVARAIADCHTPIISAVGHETDFTIADFVSDLRAPTPSAAAELAVMDAAGWLNTLEVGAVRRESILRQKIQLYRTQTEAAAQKLSHLSPENLIRQWRQNVDMDAERIENLMSRYMEGKRHSLDRMSESLRMNSPLYPLSKGYAMITDEEGNIHTDTSRMQVSSKLRAVMRDGIVHATVDSIEENRDE